MLESLTPWIPLFSILIAVLGTGFATYIAGSRYVDAKIEAIRIIVEAGTAEHAKLWEANKKQNERMDALLLAFVDPDAVRRSMNVKQES